MNVLKKILFISIIIVMASCSNNEVSKDLTPTSIVGNWLVISLVSNDVEYVQPGDCFDKYFITNDTARYLEYYESSNGCIADEDNTIDYPILEYLYDGDTFVFDGLTFDLIEVTENVIKWSTTYMDEGVSVTDIETLQRE